MTDTWRVQRCIIIIVTITLIELAASIKNANNQYRQGKVGNERQQAITELVQVQALKHTKTQERSGYNT